MKKLIIIICVVITVFSIFYVCLPESNMNLGSNYFYLPKYEAIDVGYPGGEAILYKSEQKNLFSNVILHGDVIEVNYDNDFIIAIQSKPSGMYEKPRLTEVEIKSLKYFIIYKKTDLAYGPFNKELYMQKSEELGVSPELKLEKD